MVEQRQSDKTMDSIPAGNPSILQRTLHGFRKGLGPGRNDKVLLKGQLVTSVGTTVNDIEARHGHGDLFDRVPGQIGKMFPKRNLLGGGSSLGDGQGNTENGIGPQLGLVGRTVEGNHFIVNGLLIRGIHAHNGGSQDILYILDGVQDALAEVPVAAVTQFDRFVGAGRGPLRYTGGKQHTVRRGDIDFNGGIAT